MSGIGKFLRTVFLVDLAKGLWLTLRYTPQPAFTFPCSSPLKVMGLNTADFASAVEAVFRKHLGTAEVSYARQLSSSGKYLSITATFTATSKEQLDAIYLELNRHELVKMTL